MKKINVLGTEYTLKESTEVDDAGLIGNDGYCDTTTKECVVDQMNQNGSDVKKIFRNTRKRLKDMN